MMKKNLLLLFLSIIIAHTSAQGLAGKWKGNFKVKHTKCKVFFNFIKTQEGYTAYLDCPEYKAKGFPISCIHIDKGILKMEVSFVRISFEGKVNPNFISGTLTYQNKHYPMFLTRAVDATPEVKPIRESNFKYSFYTENISFTNPTAKISLAGTLILPKKTGNYPVVVLIPDRGEHNRDEEKLGHKPFQIIAEYLAMNGIGSLRYDDRGIGQSKGDFKSATTDDFSADAQCAIAYLRKRNEVNKNKIGIIGHGEGGLIASVIASMDKDIKYVALLASPGVKGDTLTILKNEQIARTNGRPEDEVRKLRDIYTKTFNIISSSSDWRIMKEDVTDYLNYNFKKIEQSNGKPAGMTYDQFIDMKVDELTNPWMLNYLKLDPVSALQEVKCPVLVLGAQKDLEVVPEVNIAAIQAALEKAQNNKVTVKILPDLNHNFQECKTGLPDEYPSINQIISTSLLEELSTWLVVQCSK
jgi:uncharacterized protein